MSSSDEDCRLSSPDWCLVDDHDIEYRLPKTMVFLGHGECDFVIESLTVDKRHAVITYDHYVHRFKIKDLHTVNGTFINEVEIPVQKYVTLQENDTIRLGYAELLCHMKQMDRSSHKIPYYHNPSGTIGIWRSDLLKKFPMVEDSISKDVHPQSPILDFGEHSDSPQSYNEDGYDEHALDDPNPARTTTERPKSWSHLSAEERKRSTYHIDAKVDMDQNYFDTPPSPSSAVMDLPGVSDSGTESPSNYLSMDKLPPANMRKPTKPARGAGHSSEPLCLKSFGGVEDCRHQLGTIDVSGLEIPPFAGGKNNVEEQPEILSYDFEEPDIRCSQGVPRLSSAISNDGLISAGSQKGSLEISGDIGKKQPSSERELSVEKTGPVSKPVDGGGTSFTVELGDVNPRKWNASGSLSEFMPPKIRRSFRDRALKPKPVKDETSLKPAVNDSQEAKSETVLEFVPDKIKTKGQKHAEEQQTKAKKDIITPGNLPPLTLPQDRNHNNTNNNNNNNTLVGPTPPTCCGAASFLINKMFQGSTSGMSPPGTNSNMSFEGQKTEQDLYSEAEEYNKKIFQESQCPKLKYISIQDSSGDKDTTPLDAAEDKTSDAGTYTIEGEIDEQEEEMARMRIDNIFGVGQEIQRPVINAEEEKCEDEKEDSIEILSPGKRPFTDDLNLYADDSEEDDVEEDEVEEDDVEEDAPEITAEVEKDISPDTLQARRFHNQLWNSGTVDHRQQPGSAGSHPLTSKPPIGSAGKRVGTGRKLPSLPPDTASSPSSLSTQSQPQIPTTPSSKKDEKLKAVDIDRKPERLLTPSGHGKKSQNRTKLDSDDTNLLLKDTEIAMAALEARVISNSLANAEDSESDISSSSHQRKSALRSRNRSAVRRPVATRKSTSKSRFSSKEGDQQMQRQNSKGSEKGSVSSDMTSESDAMDTLSNTSDFSIDCISDSDGLNRHGSKGKGGIGMTRPNRAFQLRQAKARGTEAAAKLPPQSQTSRNVTKPSVTGKIKKANSINSPAEKPVDSRRRPSGSGSDSLHKTNDSLKMSSNSNFIRTDGGRYSLRSTRSASTSSATKPTIDRQLKGDPKSSKPQLKSAHSTPRLSMGSLSSKSSCQPDTRSSSPKNSSKKRKEFSTRKQKSSSGNTPPTTPVKSKNPKSLAPKSVADSSKYPVNGRMVRSSSVELSKQKNLEVATDKSSSKSYRDVSRLGADNVRHGFLPYRSTKASQRSIQPEQKEEEKKFQLPKSLQSCDRVIVSSIYRLSIRLRTSTDQTIQRLIESDKSSLMALLTADFLNEDSGEMPEWTSANRELAGILCNLRHIEPRVRVIDQVLFPEKDDGSEDDGLSHQRREKKKEKKLQYSHEMERIRTEMAGFQPIDNPEDKLQKNEGNKRNDSNFGGDDGGYLF